MKSELSIEAFAQTVEELRRIDFTDLSEFDFTGLPPDFKPTIAFTTIIERINYAREAKVPLATIVGTHGGGKTTALRYYAQQEGLRLWECTPKYQAKHLVTDIAKLLGVDAGTGWLMQISIVAEQLIADPQTFLIDEAQRLNYDGLDALKYIANKSGSTFVLSASPSLETRIDRWPDISSRCPVRVRINPMNQEEFIKLFAPDGFAPDTLAEIHRLTKGVFRNIRYRNC